MNDSNQNSIVTYSSYDETLVLLRKDEERFLAEYFAADVGRDINDYDRIETGAADGGGYVVRISTVHSASVEKI